MRFKNPHNKLVVEAKHPKLWTLLFGSLYFAKHRVWNHALISAILAVITGGISCIIYAFYGEKIIRSTYLEKGWLELDGDQSVSSDYNTVAEFERLIKQKNRGLITEKELNEQRGKLFNLK